MHYVYNVIILYSKVAHEYQIIQILECSKYIQSEANHEGAIIATPRNVVKSMTIKHTHLHKKFI